MTSGLHHHASANGKSTAPSPNRCTSRSGATSIPVPLPPQTSIDLHLLLPTMDSIGDATTGQQQESTIKIPFVMRLDRKELFTLAAKKLTFPVQEEKTIAIGNKFMAVIRFDPVWIQQSHEKETTQIHAGALALVSRRDSSFNTCSEEERKPPVEIEVDQVDTRETESASIASAESCDCSSPTALSQHSSGEETYSGIFKSINVGIQELREQLKMLRMGDQDDICEDYSGTLSSDEFDNINISTYRAMEEQLSMFKDEDRDFSYVQDMLASMCDLPDLPED